MRLVMHTHGRRRVGRVDQAEGRAAIRVEPIGQEANAIARLDLQILAMGLGDIGGGQTSHVVPVEENWHEFVPTKSRSTFYHRILANAYLSRQR